MTEILRKIEIEAFSNTIALEMGLKIVELANSRHQAVAVQIERLNQTVFLHVGDGLSADKHNWIRRKANVAKHFEESSFSVKQDLIEANMTLADPFMLDEKDYLAKGGAIPIFVKNAGLMGVVTVSGLSDDADHQMIVDALV